MHAYKHIYVHDGIIDCTILLVQAAPGTLLNIAMNAPLNMAHNVGASGLMDQQQSVMGSLDQMLGSTADPMTQFIDKPMDATQQNSQQCTYKIEYFVIL